MMTGARGLAEPDVGGDDGCGVRGGELVAVEFVDGGTGARGLVLGEERRGAGGDGV